MDNLSLTRLQEVCPTLGRKIEKMEIMLGEPLTVQQALRAWQRQAEIYAQGRTRPGKVVTNAPPGHSWHEFGLAVDVCPVRLLSMPDWSPDDPAWQKLVAIGESLGLFPGAKFVHAPPDLPHYQLTGRFPASPTDEVRQLFRDGGCLAVWEEAGLWNAEVDTYSGGMK